jgi:hypothetical protein
MEKLPPCPQCKVLAVSLLALFKQFGRLPIVSLSKLLFVGHVFTPGEKTPNV